MPVILWEYTHPGELGPTQYLIREGSDAHLQLSVFPNKLKDALLVLGQYMLVDNQFVWCLKQEGSIITGGSLRKGGIYEWRDLDGLQALLEAGLLEEARER